MTTTEAMLVFIAAIAIGAWAWAWHEARVAIVQFHYLMSLCRRCERLAYMAGVEDQKNGTLDQAYINDLCDKEDNELKLARRAKERP